ncbi:MAG: cupin domain-containing protein [Bacteroidales bacterium]|nr:cupin domain-containing protein [Bacteroidales bacterium]
METNVFETGKPFRFQDKVAFSEGGIVSKKVIQQEKGNVTLFSFDQGQKLSEHTAPFDALVQILEGTAEIVIGGNPNSLEAGMAIIMPANIPHAVNANEPFKMLLTMIRV